ncbi:MAG: response regulator [Lachnospiraceae bacterium]|nr:response regulator [Lachnospiraceae bacterium]
MGKQENKKIKSSINFSDLMRLSGMKNALIFPLLALIFIVIIFVYNGLLQSYAKKSILEGGELNAENTAGDIELYLSTGINALEISSYTIDTMIKDNTPDEEILEYIQHESDVIIKAMLPGSTGLYACIDGEYYDGLGWEPYEGYVPTERPWYTKALAGKGDVVLIDPYLDLYTGQVIMTLAKVLSDGESVVAIDVTLEEIQTIVERSDTYGLSSVSMVLSSEGFVVAHTDSSERGNNYLEDKDNIGGYILTTVMNSEENSFDIKYDNTSYTVYSCPIRGEWYSISYADSDKVYRPIRLIVILSIVSIVLTLLSFTIITVISGRKELANVRLQKLINSTADIYMSLCDLDVINGNVIEIKNVNPAISKAVASVDHNLNEVFFNIMNNLPESPTKKAAVEFTDMDTIDERMKDVDTLTVEYQSFGNIWVRARLIVSERTRDGKVAHVLWMLENITREREERERLKNISDSAVAANEAKSAFLSNMSHEIRTPITAVLGMNEMILRECDDPSIISYADNIKSAGTSLLVLINDILDFSKIESGKMDIIPVEYETRSLLNDLKNMIGPKADAKDLKFIMEIDPELPGGLFGDEIRIKQVITNLLTNAVKYTEKGSVTLKVGFGRKPEKTDTIGLKVSVTDTGMGIRKEDMEKLFAQFVRLDEKKNRNIEGTGLGLNITSNLLHMMGGELTVESEYGKGSVFSFEIIQPVRKRTPIGDFEKASDGDASKEKYVPRFKAPDACILMVDDTPINIVVFKGLLKKTEIKVDSAAGGRECIELATENKYDIIFLDHMMPVMDGIETLKELREKYPDNPNAGTPIVCLTANAISGAKETYMEAGFTDYLTKPINPVKLEEMIYSYLPEDKKILSQ